MRTPASSPVPSTSKGGKQVSFRDQPPPRRNSESSSEEENDCNPLTEFLQLNNRLPPQEMGLESTIDLIEKEEELNFGAETQAIVENMENKVEKSLKRKSPNKKKKEEPKKKQQKKPVLEEPTEDSFLGVLELIWTTDIYLQVMRVLKQGEVKAMSVKDLTLKREFVKMIQLWKTILKSIVHKLRETKCESLSWNAFRQILCDTELYMTCLHCKMSGTATNLFLEYANQQPQESTKDQSSGCATMATTTSTLSTTVPTPVVPVVASASKTCENYVESPDLIAELFGLPSFQRNTGSISQSISRQENGQQFILKSPGEHGLNVVKLEVYPFSKIHNLDKKHWWKHAETKMIFLTSSPVDPVQMKISQGMSQVTKQVAAIPNVAKETKEISYWNSFGDFQRRQ